MIPRLVLTGAPGSGKTDFLNRLALEPTFHDFVFFDELARRLLLDHPDYRRRWDDFHRDIYHRQCEREAAIGESPFITDRGTVDAFAFHPETAAHVGTTLAREYARYTAVIQLGSAARLGQPYYCCDDVRTEPMAEALRIETAIRNVWQGHPAYHFVDAQIDYEDKYRRFLALISQLGLPVRHLS